MDFQSNVESEISILKITSDICRILQWFRKLWISEMNPSKPPSSKPFLFIFSVMNVMNRWQFLSSYRLLGDGDLMIVNGNESHEGKYLCQANNGVGSGKSKLISINVDGKSPCHWAFYWKTKVLECPRLWISIQILSFTQFK